MNWFIYTTAPIDNGWESLPSVDPYDETLRKILERARQLTEWEGDFREHQGPHRFLLPVPDDAMFQTGYVWKHCNNGTTFVASPIKLAWLDDEFMVQVEIE